MTAEHLKSLCVLHLKVQSNKQQMIMSLLNIRMSDVFWELLCMKSWCLLFALTQALYQFYHILCLEDMQARGMDKLKYYIAHACWLLEDGLQNVVAP